MIFTFLFPVTWELTLLLPSIDSDVLASWTLPGVDSVVLMTNLQLPVHQQFAVVMQASVLRLQITTATTHVLCMITLVHKSSCCLNVD